MTKTIIIGQQNYLENNPKKIEFFKYLTGDRLVYPATKPCEYKYLELVAKDYGGMDDKRYDLIFAYDNPEKRNEGCLYFGKWNDGVV